MQHFVAFHVLRGVAKFRELLLEKGAEVDILGDCEQRLEIGIDRVGLQANFLHEFFPLFVDLQKIANSNIG